MLVSRSPAQLDDGQPAVWLLARGIPEQVAERPWTRQVLQDEAARAGTADPAQILSGLTADGLVVEAPRHRACDRLRRGVPPHPADAGPGQHVRKPWLYRMGFFQRPVLTVAGEVYSMWEWAHVDNNQSLAGAPTEEIADH